MEHSAANRGNTCILIYDGRCRMCVAAKAGLERLHSGPSSIQIRMIPYQGEEARRLLGDVCKPERPDAAFLIGPDGKLTRGLDAFLPLLPGLRGGRFMAACFQVPLVRPVAYLLYKFIARYRYRLFGEVPLEDPSPAPK